MSYSMSDDLHSIPAPFANLPPVPSADEFGQAVSGLAATYTDTAGGGQNIGPLGGDLSALPGAMNELAGGFADLARGANLADHRALADATMLGVGLPSPFPFGAEFRQALAPQGLSVTQLPGNATDENGRPPYHQSVLMLDPAEYVNNPIFNNTTIEAELQRFFPCFVSTQNISAGAVMPLMHVRNLASINAALFQNSIPFAAARPYLGAGGDPAARAGYQINPDEQTAAAFFKSGCGAWFDESYARASFDRYGSRALDDKTLLFAHDVRPWRFIGVPNKCVAGTSQPLAHFSTDGVVDMACLWPAGDDGAARAHPQAGATLWFVLVMRFATGAPGTSAVAEAYEQRCFTEQTGLPALPPPGAAAGARAYLRWEPHVTERGEPPLRAGVSGPYARVIDCVRVGVVHRNHNTRERLVRARAIVDALLYPSLYSEAEWRQVMNSDLVPRISVMLESGWNGPGEIAPSRVFSADVPALVAGVPGGRAFPHHLLLQGALGTAGNAFGRPVPGYRSYRVLGGLAHLIQ